MCILQSHLVHGQYTYTIVKNSIHELSLGLSNLTQWWKVPAYAVLCMLYKIIEHGKTQEISGANAPHCYRLYI